MGDTNVGVPLRRRGVETEPGIARLQHIIMENAMGDTNVRVPLRRRGVETEPGTARL